MGDVGRTTLPQADNTPDAKMELDLGKDCLISKILIFNRLENREALIGCVVVVRDDNGSVVFICPIGTAMKLYQIRPIARVERDRPAPQPIEEVVYNHPVPTCWNIYPPFSWFFPLPPPTTMVILHEPKKPSRYTDIEPPEEWKKAMIGDYEVYSGHKKHSGYEGDSYSGYADVLDEGGMGLWEA